MTGRPLLLAVSLVSLNGALLASASAETCVTGVNPTFANVVSDVSGQPGITVVTGVTPTMASALTNVTANQGPLPFLTSATLSPITGTAVTSVNAPTGTAVTNVGATTGTVTGITPTPGLPTNLMVPAFNPAANPTGTLFTFPNGGSSTNNQGNVTLNTTMGGGTVTLLNVPVVSGTPTSQQVVTSVSPTTGTFVTGALTAPTANNFLTSGTTVTTTAAPAITSVTPASAQFVNGLNVATAPVLTDVTPTKASVVNSVTASNSGASASASSLGCGVNAQANGANATAVGTNANTTGNLATALGANSIGIGLGATALGANAVASADGAIAIGASQSTGVNSIAIGTGAVATGSVAVGAAATAANGAPPSATARLRPASMRPPSALAPRRPLRTRAPSARERMPPRPTRWRSAPRATPYVAPGITSAASKAAQSGPLEIVASDAGGHLATNTAAGLGLASLTDINAINAQLGGMNTRLNDLDGRTTKALNGVSMAFAMGGTPWLLPTERFAVSIDWGTFQSTNAVAINGAVRLGTNVQANGGLAYGANGGGAGGRAGVRVGW